MNDNFPLGFIGGGNMATSLIAGLIKNGKSPQKIWVSDPTEAQRNRLKSTYQINSTEDNKVIIEHSQVIIFCVKPQIVSAVLKECAEFIKEKKPLIITIAAGVTIANYQHYLGDQLAIIRAMPNTPAMIGCGITGLFADKSVTSEEKSIAENILRAVGTTVWFDEEEKLNAVTAIAGSGPAYFFLVMEAMQQAGIRLGLKEEEAKLLVLETALGAARMALESEDNVEILRQKVTSPKGTTERAIDCFKEKDIFGMFDYAIRSANQRAEELSARVD